MDLTPYHRFVLLVQFDQLVLSHQKKVRSIIDRRAAVERDCIAIRDEQARAEAVAHELRKQRDALELESKSVNQDLAQKRKKLENTADIKIYTALETEIRLLESRKLELEETVFTVWQQLEDQEKAVAELAAAAVAQLAECQARLADITKELEAAESDLTSLESHRANYLVDVPAEWFATYNVMRAQYANPVVPILENACGGCGFPIPSGDRSTVFRHVLIPCQQCRRLLFDAHVLSEFALQEKPI